MKSYILTVAALLMSMLTAAQYTSQGKIEFERKSNVHRQLEDMSSDNDDGTEGWFSKIKSQVPKFKVSYFDYTFTPAESLYKPGREVEDPVKLFGSTPGANNEVYTDFAQKKVTAAKQVFEQKFLVEDSMRVIPWKITDEIRTIASYKCRKAVGKICDSVYVVAFYTDDIMVSGGPEMFSGLPGMILELAIPRLYTTWIATKVELTPPKPDDFHAPVKGKKVTQQEMHSSLMESISKWGKWAHRSIWWSML